MSKNNLEKQKLVSQDLLKSLFTYDQNTGLFKRKVALGNASHGSIAGSIHHRGYRYIAINKKDYAAHRLAWLYVYGKWPDNVIDHVNGKTDDNRIENLRDVSQKENLKNTKFNRNKKYFYLDTGAQ